MGRLPGEVDGRRFLRALARFGWAVESQRGSYRKLAHAENKRFLIVAFHDVIRRNAMRHILREAGINEDEFLEKL
jgi:predicted RNA binding protein YcfA (HicA-like mRNA interferase family)